MPRPPSTTAISRRAHDLAAHHRAEISQTADSLTLTLPPGRRWTFSRDRALTLTREPGEAFNLLWPLLVKAMEMGTYSEG